MDKRTVLVLSETDDPYLPLLEPLRGDADLVIGDHAAAFRDAAPQASVLLNWTGKRNLIEEVFHLSPRLEWMHSRYAGLDAVLFPELIASPLPLTNGRGVFSQSLGEFVVLGMLFFAKDLRRLLRNQAAGRWEQFVVSELRGATLGIVGYGDIGKACAQRAHALGMRVLALRRRPALSEADPHVDQVFPPEELAKMLGECDYVCSAAPLTPQTRHLLSDREFAAMKPECVVLNVGRGPVIDEAALIRALESKTIRGAALDVFEAEPLPSDSPLYRMENVLISPHCADQTQTWLVEAMQCFLDNYERFRTGQPLCNVVDKHAGY